MSEKERKPIAFNNRMVDKGQLKKLITWSFRHYGTARTAQMADKLKELGFRFATRAGVSISIESLNRIRIPRDFSDVVVQRLQSFVHLAVHLLI